jgi:hypothetical protein
MESTETIRYHVLGSYAGAKSYWSDERCETEDSPLPIHVGSGDCLLNSLWMLARQPTTGPAPLCDPLTELAVAFVQVIH